jgi:DNA-directed RNA polymerase specialized sigma24 family protein
MYRFRSSKNARCNPGYSTCADFCDNFAKDLQPLYRLAFLLTGGHTAAEQCLAVTIEECAGARSVFKGWERSWTKRCLIINAIRHVFRRQDEGGAKTDASHQLDRQPRRIGAIRLAQPLLRFVFVMSILEKYSIHECALLLGCTPQDAVEARIRLLRQLADLDLTLSQTAQQRMQAMVVA